MKRIIRRWSEFLGGAAVITIVLSIGQGARADESFDLGDWKDWRNLSSSTQFDGPPGAAFSEMFLGALAKARQHLRVPGDAPDFGQKAIAAAAGVNKDYAAQVRARPYFRVWLDAVGGGKLNDLVRTGAMGWSYYITRKNPLPPASFPVIYASFDLSGGRKLGVSVLRSGAYETPNPASKVGSDSRCWAGNGPGAGDEVHECPARAYLIEADGRIGQTVDFYACFVEFGDASGGAPERDVIRAAFDADRGEIAIVTFVDDGRGRKPILTGGPDRCGPQVIDIPFAKP